jgi:hypothetical protein
MMDTLFFQIGARYAREDLDRARRPMSSAASGDRYWNPMKHAAL